MTTIVHISDLHFGCEIPVVVEGLLKNLESIEPDLLVISGDLTQRARKREYIAARDFLARLECPYIIVPGNHDLSADNLVERFISPWKKWCRYISSDIEPACRGADYIAVGVNTARRLGWYLDWSRGRINAKQTDRVGAIFGNWDESGLRLLVAHHPFWLPEKFEHRQLVGSRDAALHQLQANGVDIILGGHIHEAFWKLLKGVIISHAGTTCSSRLLVDQPNSFNIIRSVRDFLSIEMMNWDGFKFECSEEQAFQRQHGDWLAI